VHLAVAAAIGAPQPEAPDRRIQEAVHHLRQVPAAVDQAVATLFVEEDDELVGQRTSSF
jgi:hypothetical protein